jgi:integrase
MPRRRKWGAKLERPAEASLLLPGAGLPNNRLRVSLETRDRELGEARLAMFRDLHTRRLFALLRARQEERFSTDRLHQAYRDGETALDALVKESEGTRLLPLVQRWAKSYQKVDKQRAITRVMRFVADHGGAKATTIALTPASIEAWLAALTNQQGRANRKHAAGLTAEKRALVEGVDLHPARPVKPASGATQNRYRATLSALSTWLVKHGHLAVHPIAHKKVEKARENDPRMPPPFTPDDYRGYLDAIGGRVQGAELRCLFLLLLHTAADIGEAMRREAWHVELDRTVPRVRFKRTKTRTPERPVPLPDAVAAEVRAHLAQYGLRGEARLFGMLSEKDWRPAHEAAAAAIGRPSLRVKDLRHIAAIAWAKAGVRIDRISQLLGHASLSQTMIYVNFQPDTTEEADIARGSLRELAGPSGVTSIAERRREA